MARVEWRADSVRSKTRLSVERGMTRAMLYLEGRIIRKISKGQPPSKPGEPWHTLYGTSKRSMTHQVEVGNREVIGRVGSNVVYVRRLELGFVGIDAAGRNINQEPRPAMRPALRESREEIVRRIARG